MSKTLDEIRKKLQALDTKKGPTGGSTDKSVYAHWNIPEGTSATIRFLPDANEDNTFFWVERQLIKLPFPGVKGQDEHKQVVVQVPCIEMWDGKNSCPILNEVRPMWKEKSLEDTARKYWVKRTFYAQGFVKQDPMNESDSPENPIRKFIIGPQIFAIIKAALMDPDMENSPVDFINGTDFIVTKTSKGGYADYGTSKWARKESSINEEMQNAMQQYGLVDLSTYLPKKPTAEQLSAMFDMFQASLEGALYDPALWGKHYKPYGFDSSNTDDADAPETQRVRPASIKVSTFTKPAEVAAVAEAVEDTSSDTESPPWNEKEEEAKPSASKSPQEILAMLRNRNKAA
jgi:hypothetical protein